MAYALPRHHAHEGQVATASGLDVLAGVWLIISPWVVGFSSLTTAMTNDVICGAIVTVLAATRFFGAYRQSWLSWINCLLGIWVLISPWALGFSAGYANTVGVNYGYGASTNNVITGIVIAVLAFWSAIATSPTDATATGRTDVDRL